MNFEKRMKKHIDQTLDEIVPNPYPNPKKPRLNIWKKIAIPLATVAAAASVTAVILPNVLGGNKNNKAAPVRNYSKFEPKSYISLPNEGYLNAAAPKAQSFQAANLDRSFVSRTALKTLQNFDGILSNPNNKDFVVSPMSYMLSIGGVIAVSDGYNLDEFGLTNPQEEIKTLLEMTNGAWKNGDKLYSKIDSGIFHQQVESLFPFVDEKRQEISDLHIGTGVANLGNYLDQAKEYFEKVVQLSIPIPDPELTDPGIVTYGALKVLDTYTFSSEFTTFRSGLKTYTVKSAKIGDKSTPTYSYYFENDQYLVFKFNINSTDLLIVLPNKGVSLNSINVSEAYESFINSKNIMYYYGYIPFFHNQTFNLDLTDNVLSHMSGDELLYSKLLKTGVRATDLEFTILQSSDFTFDENGISGESITVHGGSSSSGGRTPKEPREIIVDRPFYAISLTGNFPLFVNKVNKPSL